MLVGHEPDFSAVISALTGGSRIELKKGGLARVDIMDPATLEGVLVWLLPPHISDPLNLYPRQARAPGILPGALHKGVKVLLLLNTIQLMDW
jgi:hypothetical protein